MLGGGRGAGEGGEDELTGGDAEEAEVGVAEAAREQVLGDAGEQLAEVGLLGGWSGGVVEVAAEGGEELAGEEEGGVVAEGLEDAAGAGAQAPGDVFGERGLVVLEPGEGGFGMG